MVDRSRLVFRYNVIPKTLIAPSLCVYLTMETRQKNAYGIARFQGGDSVILRHPIGSCHCSVPPPRSAHQSSCCVSSAAWSFSCDENHHTHTHRYLFHAAVKRKRRCMCVCVAVRDFCAPVWSSRGGASC